jgi:uncharacterized protein YcfJ
MRMPVKTLLAAAVLGIAAQAAAEVTFYDGDAFRGRAFTVDGVVDNFEPTGFNDRARSAVVNGGPWEVCEHAQFQGRCVVLGPGSYDSLNGIGMSNRISSARPAGPTPATLAAPAQGYYQRPQEPLYQANVTSVRAVGGPPEQRCWVERQQVREDSGANVPGAIVGAVIGGVLGHQVGGGRGRDVATAGGAVAGAAIGANVGRGGGVYDRDVQRCTTVSGDFRPDYWEVTYVFQGVEHRAQMTAPPGATLTVNGNGEPRG